MQCLVDRKILLQKRDQRQIVVVGHNGGRAALGLYRETGEIGRRDADLVAPTKSSAIKWCRQSDINGRRKYLLLKLGERHVDNGGGNAGSSEYRKRIHVFRDIRSWKRRLSYLRRSACGAGYSPAADRSSDAIAAAARPELGYGLA